MIYTYALLFFSTTLLFASDTGTRRDSLSTSVSTTSSGSAPEVVQFVFSKDEAARLVALAQQLVAAKEEAGNAAAARCLEVFPAELLSDDEKALPAELTVTVPKSSLETLQHASKELSSSLQSYNTKQLKMRLCCGASAVCIFLPLSALAVAFLSSGSYGGMTQYSFLLASLILAPVLFCCTCCCALKKKKQTLHVSVEDFELLEEKESGGII
jgi:hypothetical protein